METTLIEWGTVSIASMLGMMITLIIAVGLPVILLTLVYKKTKAKISSFFIGCGIFVLFALILEQIMHSIVIGITGTFLMDHIILYGLYGGVAAALFEETGRWIAMKFLMKKNLNKQNALMYGVGHGGIEAIIIVGLTYVSNLLTAIMINSGSLQTSLAVLDEGIQQATYEQLKPLWELPAWQFYIAGVERLIAFILHIALSVLVYKAVKSGRKRFWLVAFLVHFAVDFLTVVISGYGAPIWLIEIVLLVIVLFLAFYVRKLYQEDMEEI